MTDDAIRISTALTDEGFEQHLDIRGHITKKVVDVLAAQSDDAFRLKLVELGWTPPAGDEANALMLLLRAAHQQGVDAATQPWQDMSTAPKDGTPVLVAVRYVDMPDGRNQRITWVQTTASWPEGRGGWHLCDAGDFAEGTEVAPLYFKPLGPNPPAHKS